MRILVFSTLYPNAAQPAHGVFVENRLRAYLKKYDADVKVVAPVPWFPSRNRMFGTYADYAAAPEREVRRDIDVLHPRYFIPPKVAMRFAPDALTRCLMKTAQSLIADGWEFDFIDAHYFYPDGVAAARTARALGKPLVITARGTDVNLLPEFQGPRADILDAARRADAIVTVASALKDALTDLGADKEKITVLRNGVDASVFHERDREAARKRLGVSGLVLASVGHLIERKGHDLVIDALRDVPDATLLIVGEGPMRAGLEAKAAANGVDDRVLFLGRIDHREMPEIYSAADVLVLASSREGWPNVLLEAMACGTPCVAADIGGVREVVRSADAGRLFDRQAPGALGAVVNDLVSAPSDREATRRYAAEHSWDDTIEGMAKIFTALHEKSAADKGVSSAPMNLGADRPRLIVTVDTEEQFDWNRFEVVDYKVNPPEAIARFQSVCAGAGATPLYFLTWPLLTDIDTSAYFKTLMASGAADCGLHLHQWVTPPDEASGDFLGEFFSYQKNLPRDVHRQKLKALAAAFEAAFGTSATAHRAGRYGIAPGDYALLAQAGVTMDFSPSVGFDFSARGGPDFSAMSNQPFVIGGEDWQVAVTPVSGARAIRRLPVFLSQENRSLGGGGFANGALPKKRRMMERHAMPVRLSPEGVQLGDLKLLTRRLINDAAPVLTFSLHSTSLTPGASPYARDERDVAMLLENSAAYFSWFQERLGGEIISLEQLRSLYAGDPRAERS